MTHLRSANGDQTANLSEFVLDLANVESCPKDDSLLAELTSEEQFPGLADMIQEILAEGDEE